MVKSICTLLLLFSFWGLCGPLTATAVAENAGQTVTGRTDQTIPEAKFREVFYNYLCRVLKKDRSDVVVSRLKIIGNKPLPSGEIRFQLFQKGKKRLGGYTTLIAVINVNGVVKNKVRVSGWVDVFEAVVCASRNLKRGEHINKDDLYLDRRNISHLSSKILMDIDKLLGLVAKHSIKADTVLKEWMLEKPPIVDREDIVTILAESGGLKVMVPGKVLMKGYMGEFVRVQNLMSKKEIYAKVTGNSTVKVDF